MKDLLVKEFKPKSLLHLEDNMLQRDRLIAEHPNAWIDIAARIDELGRQPHTARNFLIQYQDRVLFGIDMPLRPDICRCYFRFLETRDEYIEYPDYIGRWGHSRWRIYGLGLPDGVLKKIYHENALRLIPGMAEIFG